MAATRCGSSGLREVQFDCFLRKKDIDDVVWRGAGFTISTCGVVLPVVVRPSMVPYGCGAAGKTLRKLNEGAVARLPSSCEKNDDDVDVLPELVGPDIVEPMIVENCAVAGRASARSKIAPKIVARARTSHLPRFENAPIQPHE
jgi:hypothetical protein